MKSHCELFQVKNESELLYGCFIKRWSPNVNYFRWRMKVNFYMVVSSTGEVPMWIMSGEEWKWFSRSSFHLQVESPCKVFMVKNEGEVLDGCFINRRSPNVNYFRWRMKFLDGCFINRWCSTISTGMTCLVRLTSRSWSKEYKCVLLNQNTPQPLYNTIAGIKAKALLAKQTWCIQTKNV